MALQEKTDISKEIQILKYGLASGIILTLLTLMTSYLYKVESSSNAILYPIDTRSIPVISNDPGIIKEIFPNGHLSDTILCYETNDDKGEPSIHILQSVNKLDLEKQRELFDDQRKKYFDGKLDIGELNSIRTRLAEMEYVFANKAEINPVLIKKTICILNSDFAEFSFESHFGIGDSIFQNQRLGMLWDNRSLADYTFGYEEQDQVHFAIGDRVILKSHDSSIQDGYLSSIDSSLNYLYINTANRINPGDTLSMQVNPTSRSILGYVLDF